LPCSGCFRTENVGRAMLDVAKHGASKRVIESTDIEALAQNTQASSKT